MDDVVFALADPVRRRIMERLAGGRVMAAGEIASLFDVSRPAVSRHLRVLRECGLVAAEAQGRERLYRARLAMLSPLEAWLTSLRAAAAAASSSDERWSVALDALETEVYRTRRERRASTPRTEERSA